jgi:hypothetical protein
MKKVIMLVSVALFMLAPLGAQIKVIAPNGGEVLTQGQHWMIAWTAKNIQQNVRIVLIRPGGAKVGVIKDGLASGSSPFDWTIGQTADGMAAAGSYKIRVITSDRNQEDVSDNSFTIKAAGSPGVFWEPGPPSATIKVSQPDGTTWVKKSSYTITWTKSGSMPDKVNILLKRAWMIGIDVLWITESTENDGSFPWTIPDTVECEDNFFYIVITTIGANPAVVGRSAFFKIIPSPTL